MQFRLHDELGDPAAAAFASEWLPVVGSQLEALVRLRRQEEVHVVLSDASSHARRFPLEPDELSDVVNPDEPVAASDNLDEAYPRAAYSLGIATRVDPADGPPAAATPGEKAVYLDVETIRLTAGEIAVEPYALIAQVLAHEISHCLRDHMDQPGPRATHGWLAEGDAQRDAWNAMTAILGNESWATVARCGRAAQIRLSVLQPPAYRVFPAAAHERRCLSASLPVPDRRTWRLRPVRRVFRLVHDGEVELAVMSRGDVAAMGDHVLLQDDEMIAGPWVLLGEFDKPRVGDPVERRRASYEYGRPSWWQLAPSSELAADITEPNAELLDPLRVARFESVVDLPRLTRDAHALSREVADGRRATFSAPYLDSSGRPVNSQAATILSLYDPYEH